MLGSVSITTTLIGLIFFFLFFIGVAIYIYSPSRKKKMDEYGEIPLKEAKKEESKNE